MSFRVKDLMIQVFPTAGLDAQLITSPCGPLATNCTNCTNCSNCSINTCGFSPCRPPLASSQVEAIDPRIADALQLASLKQQLKQALVETYAPAGEGVEA